MERPGTGRRAPRQAVRRPGGNPDSIRSANGESNTHSGLKAERIQELEPSKGPPSFATEASKSTTRGGSLQGRHIDGQHASAEVGRCRPRRWLGAPFGRLRSHERRAGAGGHRCLRAWTGSGPQRVETERQQ
ncbi:hypothetical protein A176_002191 [Myxococcus hansupus]|uniref:Uncharacterized protein n=1 Tax=Pseudomyxococcus hansupus TaxID=1297742 RepID=A0A0H4WR73_9BACT|nr:hypothetical protein A176_002191 [Myxococcus hansupus]